MDRWTAFAMGDSVQLSTEGGYAPLDYRIDADGAVWQLFNFGTRPKRITSEDAISMRMLRYGMVEAIGRKGMRRTIRERLVAVMIQHGLIDAMGAMRMLQTKRRK